MTAMCYVTLALYAN